MHSNLARTLVIYAGGDYVFDLVVTDEAGGLVDLTDMALTFQVRRYVGGELLLEKETGGGITHGNQGDEEGLGRAELSLVAGDTLGLRGRYRYGLWLTDALGNRQPLQERGPFVVRRPVVNEGVS